MKKTVIAAALVAAFAVHLSATAVCELLCVFGDAPKASQAAQAAETPSCHSSQTSESGLRIGASGGACEHVAPTTSDRTPRPSRDALQLTLAVVSVELQSPASELTGRVARTPSPPPLRPVAPRPLRI